MPSYYRPHTGFVISAAIDKYVYITLHETFTSSVSLRYSRMEVANSLEEIQHPIFRECLRLSGVPVRNLDIASMADVPAGTGMGSSGSFTTALLLALYTHMHKSLSSTELAKLACTVEMDMLKEPVGKQDQYIAACGGLMCFRFFPDEGVEVTSLAVSTDTVNQLEDQLLLFFTGVTRSASEILSEQNTRTLRGDEEMIRNLHFIKDLGLQSKSALEKGDLEESARLMNVHWEHKRSRSRSMTDPRIDRYYELAMRNGALGGKLIGAGGGGFLMFFAEDSRRLRRAMAEVGLREMRFRFDFQGARVIAES